MGLDDFTTSGGNQNTTTTTKSKEEPEQEKEEAYRIVGTDDGREKVFQTEEDWEETKEFIEEEMEMSMTEVMDMRPDKRHQILHKAILKNMGASINSFYQKRNCIICGETFVFPHSWNFFRYKGEAVCLEHTIGEAEEKYQEINTHA